MPKDYKKLFTEKFYNDFFNQNKRSIENGLYFLLNEFKDIILSKNKFKEIDNEKLLKFANDYLSEWIYLNPYENTPEKIILLLSEVISNYKGNDGTLKKYIGLKEMLISDFVQSLLTSEKYEKSFQNIDTSPDEESSILSLLRRKYELNKKNSVKSKSELEDLERLIYERNYSLYEIVENLLELTAFVSDDVDINEEILSIIEKKLYDSLKYIESSEVLPNNIRTRVINHISERRKNILRNLEKSSDVKDYITSDLLLTKINTASGELIDALEKLFKSEVIVIKDISR